MFACLLVVMPVSNICYGICIPNFSRCLRIANQTRDHFLNKHVISAFLIRHFIMNRKEYATQNRYLVLLSLYDRS